MIGMLNHKTHSQNCSIFLGDEVDETAKLRKENKKLKKYIDKFKEELKGLDHVGNLGIVIVKIGWSISKVS